jgi:Mrp family chromosome partitioning ATPase
VARAAESGSPATTSSFASLERTLERTIDRLTKGESSPETRALLIEARRLRSVIANWRSIPPPEDVYDEMLDRVLHLSTAAGASLYDPGPTGDGAPRDPAGLDGLRAEFSDYDAGRTEFDAGRTEFDAGKTEFDARLELDDAKTELTPLSPGARASDRRPMERADPRVEITPPRHVEAAPPRHVEIAPPRHVEPYHDGAASGPKPRAPAEPDPEISTEEITGDETQVYASDFEPRAFTQEGSAVERAAKALGISFTGRDATPGKGSPAQVAGSANVQAARARLAAAAVGQQLRTGMRAPAIAPRYLDDDPPSYPHSDARPPAPSDPPSYPHLIGDAPSYPAFEVPRGLARHGSQPPPARAPSYPPPPRPPASPPPPAFTPSSFPPAPLPAPERMRSIPPPQLETDGPQEESAELAPQTEILVQPVPIGEKLDPHLVLLSDAYSPRADAYRALRRKLASTGNPQVIGVTSPDPGEGKTTCALNLALAIRETSRGRVLLIEANVRAPSIAKALGFSTIECFCEQLLGHREDPRTPWIAVEPLPKLHVMSIDPTIKRAPGLDAVAFGAGMERLKRAGYEYIVLDTPPVLGSFEVNMIADTVDGMLFATMTMKSKKSHIRKAIEQIMPAPILGVMVLDA